MLTQEIITYLLGLAALVSIGFSVYNSLKKPQEKSAIDDAVFDVKLNNLSSTNSEKINSLEKLVINLRDNHIHSLDQKLDKHISDQQVSSLDQARWQGRVETLLENISKK